MFAEPLMMGEMAIESLRHATAPERTSYQSDCPELKNIYGDGFNPNVSDTHPNFEIFLTSSNTSAEVREACWHLYEDIIFLTIFHELAEDDFLSWNEFGELDGKNYNSYVTGLTRVIAGDGSETTPFSEVAWNSKWDHQYLFARTFINGMSVSYASESYDPMRYFAKNYSETVGSNWMGIESFCDGSLTSLDEFGLPDSCLLRDWYSIYGVQNYVNTDVYSKYIDIIRIAIHDSIYEDEGQDPTDGALGARPANRIWGSVIKNLGLGPHDQVSPPQAPHPPFIFQTHIGQIVELQWVTKTDEADNEEWYPNGIWSNGGFTPINDLPPDCTNSNETIPQAYMRHLRELFNQSAQGDLLNGYGRTSYGRHDARFGIPFDPASTSARGIHAHVLWPEWVTITDETGNSIDVISSLSWYTFRFTRPMRVGENIAERTFPVYGNEFIMLTNNQIATSTNDDNVLPPVGCGS